MKGTPDAPQCGFSMAVSNILKILEVNFKGVNVLENQELRQGIKEYSDWPTIPQLYIKNEFVGGCDIIKEMFESGELTKLFESKNFYYTKNGDKDLNEIYNLRNDAKINLLDQEDYYLLYQIDNINKNRERVNKNLFINFVLTQRK